MKYREVMEILKKYPYSNNFFITGGIRSSSAARENNSNIKDNELSGSKNTKENDSNTNHE